MLKNLSSRVGFTAARGFSLIEMMVAIVMGMVVAAGAVLLIVAIDKSNSETIQSTRINQELRALAGVIGDEIKRARRLHDPIGFAGQGLTAATSLDFVDTSTSGCILYAYQDAPLNATTASTNNALVTEFEEIYLKTTAGVGVIMFGQKADSSSTLAASHPLACSSSNTTTSTQLSSSSSQINVTGLTFQCVTSSAAITESGVKSATCDEIDVTITAKLAGGDKYEKTVSHSYVQQVFIRSGSSASS